MQPVLAEAPVAAITDIINLWFHRNPKLMTVIVDLNTGDLRTLVESLEKGIGSGKPVSYYVRPPTSDQSVHFCRTKPTADEIRQGWFEEPVIQKWRGAKQDESGPLTILPTTSRLEWSVTIPGITSGTLYTGGRAVVFPESTGRPLLGTADQKVPGPSALPYVANGHPEKYAEEGHLFLPQGAVQMNSCTLPLLALPNAP